MTNLHYSNLRYSLKTREKFIVIIITIALNTTDRKMITAAVLYLGKFSTIKIQNRKNRTVDKINILILPIILIS